jgi:hypothetical protein
VAGAIAVIGIVGAHVVTSHRLAAPSPSASDKERTGLKGVALTDDHMHFNVATKNPDGSISFREVVGRQQAERLVRSTENGNLTSGKERGVER